jgi:uncharacterized protein YdgA (DUF945 family)
MKSLLALVAILFVLLLLAPWLVGSQIEQRYGAFLSPLERHGLERLGHSYQRGWFNAEARTHYAGLRSAEERTLSPPFTLHSRIEHGPWPWSQLGRGGWWPSAAYMETRVVRTEARAGDDAELQLGILIALDGSGNIQIEEGTYHGPPAHLFPGIEATELQGRLEFGPDFSWVRGKAGYRHLDLSQGKHWRLAIDDLSIQLDQVAVLEAWLVGRGRLSLGEARLLWDVLPNPLVLRGVEVVAESGAETGLLGLAIDSDIAELTLGDESYGPAEVRVQLTDLPGPTLARLLEGLGAAWVPLLESDRSADTQVAGLAEGFLELLNREPKFSLAAQMKTPEGSVRADVRLRPTGFSADDLSHPPRWLSHLSGEVELHIPEPLSRRMLGAWMRHGPSEAPPQGSDQQLPPGDDEARVAMAVDRQLADLLRQDLLVRVGKDLVTVARLGSGLLAINGRTFPLSLGELNP